MRKLTALCVATLMCSPVSAQSYFSQLLIFGDSLLDSGNLGLRFTNRVGDGNGDFTVGDYANIAPQYLGTALGLPTDPAVSGGTNYAVGGYETADILNSINGTGLALPADVISCLAIYLTWVIPQRRRHKTLSFQVRRRQYRRGPRVTIRP